MIATLLAAAGLTGVSGAASAWGWIDSGETDNWGFGDVIAADFSFGMNFTAAGSARGRDYNAYRLRNGYGYYPEGDGAGDSGVPGLIAETTVR